MTFLLLVGELNSRVTFPPYAEQTVSRIDLDKCSRALGRAWKYDAAVEFNKLMLVKTIRERFTTNLTHTIKARGYESPEAFAKAIPMSEILVTRTLAGMSSFTYASVIVDKLGLTMTEMLYDDLVLAQAERSA